MSFRCFGPSGRFGDSPAHVAIQNTFLKLTPGEIIYHALKPPAAYWPDEVVHEVLTVYPDITKDQQTLGPALHAVLEERQRSLEPDTSDQEGRKKCFFYYLGEDDHGWFNWCGGIMDYFVFDGVIRKRMDEAHARQTVADWVVEDESLDGKLDLLHRTEPKSLVIPLGRVQPTAENEVMRGW